MVSGLSYQGYVDVVNILTEDFICVYLKQHVSFVCTESLFLAQYIMSNLR